MKFLFYYVSVYLLLQNVNCEMTEKQVNAATKLIRNVCQPKNKVSNAQIDAMHNGEFEPDKSLMCYMECCLRTAKLMKDGQFDLSSLLAQAKNLPESRRQPSIDSGNNCKDAVSSSDKCEAALQIYKCFYDDNSQNFFLP